MFFAIAIAAALAISAVVLVLQAILLWLAMWWLGFAPPQDLEEEESPTKLRFGLVLLACVVNSLIVLGISAAGAVAALMVEDRALMASGNRMVWLLQALPIIMLILQAPVAWVCLQRIVGLRWSDAAIATMVLLLSGHGLSIPARLVESSLGGAYRVTNDGMAPAVLCGACGALLPQLRLPLSLQHARSSVARRRAIAFGQQRGVSELRPGSPIARGGTAYTMATGWCSARRSIPGGETW